MSHVNAIGTKCTLDTPNKSPSQLSNDALFRKGKNGRISIFHFYFNNHNSLLFILKTQVILLSNF